MKVLESSGFQSGICPQITKAFNSGGTLGQDTQPLWALVSSSVGSRGKCSPCRDIVRICSNIHKASNITSGQEQALDKLLHYYSFPWICQQGFGIILSSHGQGSAVQMQLQMRQRTPFRYFHDPLGEPAVPGSWAECILDAVLFNSLACALKILLMPNLL